MKRRSLLLAGALSILAGFLGWIVSLNPFKQKPSTSPSAPLKEANMSAIQDTFPLDFHWPTRDPFLFCAFHRDLYPKGTDQFGPEPDQLSGRLIGQDFQVRNGFRMYHGDVVPGFPLHPHRGFETITLVREGFVDHADSLGQGGRYGKGDVQWMTAGAGIQHSEMFPLLDPETDNTLEILQLWINLPQKNKMAPAGYEMYWAEKIPVVELDAGNTRLEVIAGSFEMTQALPAPKDSWANDSENEVAVWVIESKAGSSFELPAARGNVHRNFYFYKGSKATIAGAESSSLTGFELDPSQTVTVVNGDEDATFLVMQGKPIAEPIAQHGPFVMNNRAEIQQAIADYQRTQFGGWPWDRTDMVHGGEKARFAKYSDGREERPS